MSACQLLASKQVLQTAFYSGDPMEIAQNASITRVFCRLMHNCIFFIHKNARNTHKIMHFPLKYAALFLRHTA